MIPDAPPVLTPSRRAAGARLGGFHGAGLAVLLATAAGSVSGQVIVFDNQTAISGGPFAYFGHGGAEHGDEIELAGTARDFHSLTLRYSYEGTGGGSAVVRLYQLDGLPVGGFDTPGTALLTTAPLSLSPGLGSLLVTSPTAFVLPDTVAFTVQFDLPSGAQAGLIVAGDATVGFSFNDDIWQRDGGGDWFLFQDPFLIGGQIYGNLSATLAAVPEPAAATLAGALLLAGWVVCRRRIASASAPLSSKTT